MANFTYSLFFSVMFFTIMKIFNAFYLQLTPTCKNNKTTPHSSKLQALVFCWPCICKDWMHQAMQMNWFTQILRLTNTQDPDRYVLFRNVLYSWFRTFRSVTISSNLSKKVALTTIQLHAFHNISGTRSFTLESNGEIYTAMNNTRKS